jgi:hypothetical protein
MPLFEQIASLPRAFRVALLGVLAAFAVVGAHVAAAALGGPTATTGKATAVAATSATLNGTVNPEGTDTKYYFEYGPTSTYGTSTPVQDAGSGTRGQAVSAQIGSLSPNTKYHYQLVATNALGQTAMGGDQTLTTPAQAPQPPVVTTGSPSSVTAMSATLAGSIDPQGQPTTYYFQYGTSTAYGAQTAQASVGTSRGNVSAQVGSLSPNTTYHYRLVASNGAGTTTGADKTFTTATVLTPPVVTTGAVTAEAPTSATVAGTVNPEGSATTNYFEYGVNTAYGARTPTASAGSGSKVVNVSGQVGPLSPSTTYHYRLVATNPSGSAFGGDGTFKTAPPPSVTLGASPDPLVFGQSTWLNGAALVSGSLQTAVTLQQAPSRSGPFVGVQSVTSVTTGEFVFGPLSPATTTFYRAVAGGVVSPPVQVAVRFRITLFANKSHSRRGGPVRFHGTVAPAHNGGHVLLQWLAPNHRWQTLRRLLLHRTRGGLSAYSTLIRLSQGGRWRAVAQPDLNNAKGFSQVLRIHVRKKS